VVSRVSIVPIPEEYKLETVNWISLNTSVPLTLYTLPSAISKFSLDFKLSLLWLYVKVFLIVVEPIPIPAPSRRILVGTVDAIPTLKSASSILDESTINSSPSTYKSPLILTDPVLSPTPAGSINISAGPLIVLEVTLIADPSAPVWKAVAVAIPEILTLSSSVCPSTSKSALMSTALANVEIV